LNDGFSSAIQEFLRWPDLRMMMQGIIASGRPPPRIYGTNSDGAGRDAPFGAAITPTDC
jgi:hypothetical protein